MSGRLEEYPIFWPSDLSFFSSPRDKWTKGETEAWAEWLRGSVLPRTDQLRTFLRVAPDLPAPEQFAAASKAAVDLTTDDPSALLDAKTPTEIDLRGHTVHVEASAVPSALTFSLGVDLALLMARLLLETHQGGTWEIVWKPRDHVSYRNPVLTWPTGAQLDPFQFGRGFANRLANRDLDDAYVRRLYANWEAMTADDKR